MGQGRGGGGEEAETRILRLYRKYVKNMCHLREYVCHLRGHNSVILTWIKIPFPLCTCSMHMFNAWLNCVASSLRQIL